MKLIGQHVCGNARTNAEIHRPPKCLSGLTEQALSDCPTTVVDITNIIHTLKLLACHNAN